MRLVRIVLVAWILVAAGFAAAEATYPFPDPYGVHSLSTTDAAPFPEPYGIQSTGKVSAIQAFPYGDPYGVQIQSEGIVSAMSYSWVDSYRAQPIGTVGSYPFGDPYELRFSAK